MANTLGVYKPIFYAQEALAQLEKALGFASRVHRGFEAERTSFGKGQTISIRRPANFTVNAAPATAEDITTETVNIELDQWREVKFKLSDQELAYTGERIINDHIRPAAVALASDIDLKLSALVTSGTTEGQSLGGIGNQIDSATADAIAIADIVGGRGKLFDNGVPLGDGNTHFCIDGAAEADLLNLSAFTQHQGAGLEGVQAQRTGSIGTKYGIEIFANQNAGLETYVAGTAANNDSSLLINGALDPGDTVIVMDGSTDSETILVGDSLTINGKHYTVSVGGTSASSAVTCTIAEGLVEAAANNAVVTVNGAATTRTKPLIMFHRDAMALAMAPLPTMPRELGANVAVVTDPITGLSIRSRIYYVGNSSEVHVALDVLYGVKLLNSMFAVKVVV